MGAMAPKSQPLPSQPLAIVEMLVLACRHYFCAYIKSMILQLKLRKTGNSLGMVLPVEALAHLGVADGDTVFITDMADGALRVSAFDPEFARKIKAAESISREYRNALKELAAR
jgi:putative addiction module antidote